MGSKRMSTNQTNRNAPDNRQAGSLAGLGYSPVAPDEPVFLYQRKLNGTDRDITRARGFPTDLLIFPVHRVQRVNIFTGGEFQSNQFWFVPVPSGEDSMEICLGESHV